jgi:hypothetical protein
MRILAVMLMAGLLVSCGVVGPPVAPERVGVAPTIERQKKQQEEIEAQRREKAREAEEDDSDQDMEEHDGELPPLQPVGTR